MNVKVGLDDLCIILNREMVPIINPCPFLKHLQQLYIWAWLSSNKNDKIWFTHCLDSNSQSTQCKSIEDALDILRKHEMEHTVRFSVWSSPKGFGDSGKDIYSTKLKNVFRKKFKRQQCSFLKIAKLMLKKHFLFERVISKKGGWMLVGHIFRKKIIWETNHASGFA